MREPGAIACPDRVIPVVAAEGHTRPGAAPHVQHPEIGSLVVATFGLTPDATLVPSGETHAETMRCRTHRLAACWFHLVRRPRVFRLRPTRVPRLVALGSNPSPSDQIHAALNTAETGSSAHNLAQDRTMIRRTATAALMYTLAACVFTWPLVLHPHARFGAMDPTGDPSLYLWTLGWDLHTLASHPTWLLTGRVFNAGIFFPAPLTLAYSDHLLLQAVALWPVYAVTRDLIFCYNVLLIGSLVAAALAMHLLARALTDSEAAASVGGLIFGFAPYHFTHLIHVQLQALYFLPLSFFFLHRLFAAERRSDTIALGVVTALQTVSSIYYGVIGAVGLACGDGRSDGRDRTDRRLARSPTEWSPQRRWRSSSPPRGRFHTSALLETPAAGARCMRPRTEAPCCPAICRRRPTNLLYGRTGWLRPGARALRSVQGWSGAGAVPRIRRNAARGSRCPGRAAGTEADRGRVLSSRARRPRAVARTERDARRVRVAVRGPRRHGCHPRPGAIQRADAPGRRDACGARDSRAGTALDARRPLRRGNRLRVDRRGILQRCHRVPGAACADHRGWTLAARAAGIRRRRLRADGPVCRQHPVHAPVARARTRDRERLQRLATAVLRGAPRCRQPPPRASGARDPPRSRRRVRRQRRPSRNRSRGSRCARGTGQLRRPAHLSGRVVARDRSRVHGDHGRCAARAWSAAVRGRRIGDVPRPLDERPDECARGRRHDCRPASAERRRATGFRCWRRPNPGCRASTRPTS